jgi:hypothetical protein
MHRLSFHRSARIAGPDLFMHLRRVAGRRTADFYFFYVDAGLVVFLNAIQTRLVVSECCSWDPCSSPVGPSAELNFEFSTGYHQLTIPRAV